MPAVTEAASSAFRNELAAVVGGWDVTHSRVWRLLADPRSPPRFLRAFALKIHGGAIQFPGVLASFIEHAPDQGARAVLMQNLLEEEGRRIVAGHGLVSSQEGPHHEWSARFAAACGVDAAKLTALTRPSLDAAAIDAMLAEGRWLEAVAYMLVGQETTFGKACLALTVALRRRGFNEPDVVFFSRHAAADEKHGCEAVDLIAARARTREEQLAAIRAASEGARAWRAQYDSP